MDDSQRFAWARLNADTLFLALLATGAGFFDLIDPTDDSVVAMMGGEPTAWFYIRALSYVLGGLLLGAALMGQSIRVEALARSVIIGGTLLNVLRHGHWVGWTDSDTLASGVLLTILTLTTWLRFSVLMGRQGLLISRPAPKRGGER